MQNEIMSPKVLTAPMKEAVVPNIKIAYMILVHNFPEQFKRLFKAIYDPENYYLLHIDKKASSYLQKELKAFLQSYSNVFVVSNRSIVFGGYSIVQAELDGMRYLLKVGLDWDYFINLSGQDFPLRSQKVIREYLAENKGRNYIKIVDQKLKRVNSMNNLHYYFEESGSDIFQQANKRSYLENVIPYTGGKWMILSRECCSFICNNGEVKKYENFYRNTFNAHESFFQTVLMNTSFNGPLINDDKRINVSISKERNNGSAILITDSPFLSTNENIFARKFDDNTGSNIFKMLKQSYNVSLVNNSSKKNFTMFGF